VRSEWARERVWIRIHAVARADHPFRGGAKRNSHSRRKLPMAHRYAHIPRYRPNPADQDFILGDIVSLHAAMIASRNRIQFVPHSHSYREVARGLPLIANVESVSPHAG